MIKLCFLPFHLLAVKRMVFFTASCVEFKKWRIDFKKQDAHTFIFYFQNIEMPVAIFASFRVSLIYVVGEF